MPVVTRKSDCFRQSTGKGFPDTMSLRGLSERALPRDFGGKDSSLTGWAFAFCRWPSERLIRRPAFFADAESHCGCRPAMAGEWEFLSRCSNQSLAAHNSYTQVLRVASRRFMRETAIAQATGCEPAQSFPESASVSLERSESSRTSGRYSAQI